MWAATMHFRHIYTTSEAIDLVIPGAATAIYDDISPLYILRGGCKGVLQVLPRASPWQVVHHNLYTIYPGFSQLVGEYMTS